MRFVLALLAVGLIVVAPAASATKSKLLVATVGPGFKISLTSGGVKVTTLRAGTYTIKVHDNAVLHNFRLKGPGVNKASSVNATAFLTWIVKLVPGKYHYQCDPHRSFMFGHFTVK